MADRLIKTETLTDIADAIREKKETTDPIRTEAFAAEIRSITGGGGSGEDVPFYDGEVTADEGSTATFTDDYTEGKADGITEGIEEGKRIEWGLRWDAIQEYGKRTNYQYGFAGKGWTNETFRPKYDIKPKSSLLRCFVNTGITGSLTDILQRQGVVLDTSGADDVQFMFDSNTEITEIPHIVCNKSAAGLFSWCLALVKASIEVNENTAFSSSLHRCDALEELTVLGTIGKNGFDAQYSTKLSRASHESIMAALSTTTTGLTVTFSKKAVDKAFETAEGANDGSTSAEWATLVATRSNWTIALA